MGKNLGIAETVATHDLKAKDIQGTKQECHQQIVESVEGCPLELVGNSTSWVQSLVIGFD